MPARGGASRRQDPRRGWISHSATKLTQRTRKQGDSDARLLLSASGFDKVVEYLTLVDVEFYVALRPRDSAVLFGDRRYKLRQAGKKTEEFQQLATLYAALRVTRCWSLLGSMLHFPDFYSPKCSGWCRAGGGLGRLRLV